MYKPTVIPFFPDIAGIACPYFFPFQVLSIFVPALYFFLTMDVRLHHGDLANIWLTFFLVLFVVQVE